MISSFQSQFFYNAFSKYPMFNMVKGLTMQIYRVNNCAFETLDCTYTRLTQTTYVGANSIMLSNYKACYSLCVFTHQ